MPAGDEIPSPVQKLANSGDAVNYSTWNNMCRRIHFERDIYRFYCYYLSVNHCWVGPAGAKLTYPVASDCVLCATPPNREGQEFWRKAVFARPKGLLV